MPATTNNPPRKFDNNLVVIGAGSAGLVTSYVAAAAKAKVTLIEREAMGGDCLNTGCVPSKAIIRSAKIASYFKRADEFGLKAAPAEVDFPAVMQRVRDVIAKVEPHDSVERYTSLGVDCVAGSARIVSPWEVEVNGRVITTRSIVIATGGRPFVPPIPGIDEVEYLTSDSIWKLDTLPRRLLVLGGGPIGSELAQAFSRLGSEVTQVEKADRILGREDEETSQALMDAFRAEGIRLLTGFTAERFMRDGDEQIAVCVSDSGEERVAFDKVLVALGRRANTDGLDIENAGLSLNENGTLPVNDYLQSAQPHILGCGDVTGPYQLTHAAGFQGWFCAMNALFGNLKRFKVDYSVMPWAVFTDPEIGRVGITAAEAEHQGIPYEVTRYGIDDLDRAMADSEDKGFVKIVTAKGSDKILGATVVGHHAGELITEYVTAMKHGMGLRKILNTIHIYPTLSEANRYAAGEWQKARISPLALRVAERFNRWRRG